MIAIAFLFLLFLAIAQATSRGAGQSACMDITPQPGHGGSSQPLERSPFSLNISQLTAAGGYTPGATYILILTGGTSQYRGLLVQGRHGTTPVGSFTAGNLVQPFCASNSAVTHTDNSLKNNVQLTWTAPDKGTGSIVFSYAVVVQMSTYYATLTSPAIAELVGAAGSSASTSIAASSISPNTSSVAMIIGGTATSPAIGVPSSNYPSPTPATTPMATPPATTPAIVVTVVGQAFPAVIQSSIASLILLVLLGIFAVHRIAAY